VHSENIPGTYRPVANRDNDYLMDREAQRRGEYFSGIKGIAIQDSSLQESMGPIVDRAKERLVSADSGIVKARAKLRKAALALQENGTVPPGVDPAHHRVRSAAVVLPRTESFVDASADALVAEPGKPHATV
jgi:phthalate 4,5-dioxygenase